MSLSELEALVLTRRDEVVDILARLDSEQSREAHSQDDNSYNNLDETKKGSSSGRRQVEVTEVEEVEVAEGNDAVTVDGDESDGSDGSDGSGGSDGSDGRSIT